MESPPNCNICPRPSRVMMISCSVSNRLIRRDASTSPFVRARSEEPLTSEKKIVTWRRPDLGCSGKIGVDGGPTGCTEIKPESFVTWPAYLQRDRYPSHDRAAFRREAGSRT